MNTIENTYKTLEAQGLKLRPVRWEDLDAVVDLILEVCTADGDPTVAFSKEDAERSWKKPSYNLETDTWVVETQSGRLVGYEDFHNRYKHAALRGDGYVHPDFTGLGIGTTMLRYLDQRAHAEVQLAEPDLRIFIRNGLARSDIRGCELHENEGYKPIRYSWRMEINLTQTPPEPVWPAGITLRPFILEQHNHLVFEADNEAFLDHWGHTPLTYELWQHYMTSRMDFDPTLWFIAWDGDQVAGTSLCSYRKDLGWVGSLGVRRPWRKRGLGLALLSHSFGEFFRRGTSTIGLGVDAANPTGATRLYLKAGMVVANEYVTYEKELRAGREISLKED